MGSNTSAVPAAWPRPVEHFQNQHRAEAPAAQREDTQHHQSSFNCHQQLCLEGWVPSNCKSLSWGCASRSHQPRQLWALKPGGVWASPAAHGICAGHSSHLALVWVNALRVYTSGSSQMPTGHILAPKPPQWIGWFDSKLLVWANSVTGALKTELCHLIRAEQFIKQFIPLKNNPSMCNTNS